MYDTYLLTYRSLLVVRYVTTCVGVWRTWIPTSICLWTTAVSLFHLGTFHRFCLRFAAPDITEFWLTTKHAWRIHLLHCDAHDDLTTDGMIGHVRQKATCCSCGCRLVHQGARLTAMWNHKFNKCSKLIFVSFDLCTITILLTILCVKKNYLN